MIIVPIIISQEDLDNINETLCSGLDDFPWLWFLISTIACSSIHYFFIPPSFTRCGFSLFKLIMSGLVGAMSACALMLLWLLVSDLCSCIVKWIGSKSYYWRNR